MQLTAAVQLSYLPEQGQKLALNASEKYGIKITEGMAAKVRKGPMIEKAITEDIARVQPESDPLGLPVEKNRCLNQSNFRLESEKSISQKQTQRKWKTLLIRLLQPGLRKEDRRRECSMKSNYHS